MSDECVEVVVVSDGGFGTRASPSAHNLADAILRDYRAFLDLGLVLWVNICRAGCPSSVRQLTDE